MAHRIPRQKIQFLKSVKLKIEIRLKCTVKIQANVYDVKSTKFQVLKLVLKTPNINIKQQFIHNVNGDGSKGAKIINDDNRLRPTQHHIDN